MRSLLAWIRRVRQHIYCDSHVGDCAHCREWKHARVAQRHSLQQWGPMPVPESPPVTPVVTRSARSPRWDFMGRYQVRVDGELFIDRLRIIQCPWFAVLLSRIYRDDTGRDPHNHSRAFWTCILSGGYTERVCGTRAPGVTWTRGHRRFSVKYLPVTCAHQITGIRGPLRTLLIAGRHHGTFWFWTPDGPVDWRDYGKPAA